MRWTASSGSAVAWARVCSEIPALFRAILVVTTRLSAAARWGRLRRSTTDPSTEGVRCKTTASRARRAASSTSGASPSVLRHNPRHCTALEQASTAPDRSICSHAMAAVSMGELKSSAPPAGQR